MSDVKIVGRLGRDVVTFNNNNGSKTHILNVARPRNYADRNGEYGVDFIEVKAFTQTEKAHNFYATHMKKGRLVEVSANFLSNTYEKNGETVYSMDVIVDDINPFHERISTQQAREQQAPVQTQAPVQNQAPAQATTQAPAQQYAQQTQAPQAPQAPTQSSSPFDFI